MLAGLCGESSNVVSQVARLYAQRRFLAGCAGIAARTRKLSLIGLRVFRGVLARFEPQWPNWISQSPILSGSAFETKFV